MVDINLAEAPARQIAALILKGNKELGEVPANRRKSIITAIQQIREEEAALLQKKLKAEAKKKEAVAKDDKAS